MPRVNGVTMKQKKLVQRYIKTGDITQAAAFAYPDAKPHNRHNVGWTTMQKPYVKEYMGKLLDRAGLSDEKISAKLKDIVDAGTTRKALKGAKVNDALTALHTTLKLKDAYPIEKKQIDKRTAVLNIDLKGKSQKQLQGILDGLIKETRNFKKVVALDEQVNRGK